LTPTWVRASRFMRKAHTNMEETSKFSRTMIWRDCAKKLNN
jgi:hypothetical protein